MSFTSLKFIVFFAGAALGWYALPKRLKKPWLLLACYIFYTMVRPAFALLLAGETLEGCVLETVGQGKRWWGFCVALPVKRPCGAAGGCGPRWVSFTPWAFCFSSSI